jgi:hypothetical protein
VEELLFMYAGAVASPLAGKVLDKVTAKLAQQMKKLLGAGATKPTAARGATKAAGQGFRSYSAFKQAMGPAGEGLSWHHIVEQTPGNISRFGPEVVHSTGNIMRLEAATHTRLSGFYSSIQERFTGSSTLRVRQWLATQSFEEQVAFGAQALEYIRTGVWP